MPTCAKRETPSFAGLSPASAKASNAARGSSARGGRRVWLGTFRDAVFLATFSQQNVARALGEYGTPMAAPRPKGALGGRTVTDIPSLHRLLVAMMVRIASALASCRPRWSSSIRPAIPGSPPPRTT